MGPALDENASAPNPAIEESTIGTDADLESFVEDGPWQSLPVTRKSRAKDFRQLEGPNVTARDIVAWSTENYPQDTINRDRWPQYEAGERPETPLREIVEAALFLKQNKRHVAVPFFFDVYGFIRREHRTEILAVKMPNGQPYFPDKVSTKGLMKPEQYDAWKERAAGSSRNVRCLVPSMTPRARSEARVSAIEQSDPKTSALAEEQLRSGNTAALPSSRGHAARSKSERETILELAAQFTNSQEEWRHTILALKDRVAAEQQRHLLYKLDRVTRRYKRYKRKYKAQQSSIDDPARSTSCGTQTEDPNNA